MKFAYLSSAVIPSSQANSVHIMKMCAAFAACGLAVDLYATDWTEEGRGADTDAYALYGVPRTFALHRLPMLHPSGSRLRYLFGTVGYSLRLRTALRASSPDFAYGRYLPGCFAAALAGIPVMYEAHLPVWEHRLEHRLFRMMRGLPAFRGLVVISEALRELYVQEGIIERSRVFVAHDGADPQPDFTPLPDWPGRPGAMQVGYTGNLYPGRGIGLIRTLAESFPEMDFHLVGGREEDIRRNRSECALPNIHYHGWVPPEAVHRYRSSCDVLLAPYQPRVSVQGSGDISGYMSPLKVFEYMASRRAIICSSLPVLREIFHDGNCILVAPDDAGQWRAALVALRDDPERRQRLADTAYREFCERYTWARRAREIARHAGVLPGAAHAPAACPERPEGISARPDAAAPEEDADSGGPATAKEAAL